MRIWSIHPTYLDTKGLVALWRETLLAKHVLEGRTKGYTRHPQLERFKALPLPVSAINQYLAGVYEESYVRGYRFDREKINWDFQPVKLNVTTGQVAFEWMHLLEKLKVRDIQRFEALQNHGTPFLHPLFLLTEGEIEPWERAVYIKKADR